MSSKIAAIIISVSLLLQPISAFAQVINPNNTPGTNATINRFNPSVGLSGSGNAFQGLNFSGVGGALLSCTNVGSSITNSLSGLFNKSGQGSASAVGSVPGVGAAFQIVQSGNQVPVKSKDTDKELAKQTKTQNCLNGVAYAIAKNMLQQVTNRTLNFVNKGFAGNPLYVKDIDSYLGSIRDEKINSFLQTVAINDPIFGNALRSSITQQVTGWTDGRLTQVMNTPEGKAYQDFQDDFTQGGWQAFLNPKNNAVGAYFNAVDSISGTIDTAQQNVKDELAQGNGFLSVKKCVEYATPPVNPLSNSCNYIYVGNYASCCQSVGGAATNQAQCKAYTGGYQSTTVATSGTAPKCLRYENVTPGKVVAEQTVAVTTSNVRQLEQADQINEVLGSFFDQLLTRLFSNGLGSLSGTGSSRCSGGSGIGCNVVIGTNGQPLSSSSAAQGALGYQQANGGFNGDFDISRPQQLRAVIQTQADYLNRAIDSKIALSRIVPVLGALDYCIPGPNPTWSEGLNDNFSSYIGSLQQPSPDNPSTFQNIVNSIPIIGGLFGGTPKPPPILASAGYSFFDKVTNNSLDTKDRPVWDGKPLMFGPFGGGNFGVDPIYHSVVVDDNVIEVMRAYIQEAYAQLTASYTNNFKPSLITSAFVNVAGPTAAAQTLAQNQIDDSLKEVSKLVSYNLATAEYNAQYNDSISQTQYALRELNDINTQVNQIVATAKARYIAQQAAAGTPVNVDKNPITGKLCIDEAYTVNTAPITGAARVESDTPDSFMLRSFDASDYFYKHLSYTPN